MLKESIIVLLDEEDDGAKLLPLLRGGAKLLTLPVCGAKLAAPLAGGAKVLPLPACGAKFAAPLAGGAKALPLPACNAGGKVLPLLLTCGKKLLLVCGGGVGAKLLVCAGGTKLVLLVCPGGAKLFVGGTKLLFIDGVELSITGGGGGAKPWNALTALSIIDLNVVVVSSSDIVEPCDNGLGEGLGAMSWSSP